MNIFKSTKKFIIAIIIGFIIILAIVLGIVAFVEHRKWTQSEEYKQQQINKKYKDTLDVQALFLESGQYLLYINNNSNDYLNIHATITFYDKDKSVLEEKKLDVLGTDKGSTVKTFILSINSWDKYKLEYNVEETVLAEKVNKNLIGIYLDNKKKTIEVTNDLDDTIDHINIGIIYYLNGKIVGYQSHSLYDIEANTKKERLFLEPYDTINRKAIDYTSVEYTIEEIVTKNK